MDRLLGPEDHSPSPRLHGGMSPAESFVIKLVGPFYTGPAPPRLLGPQ
jgi:hypothetical protein